MAELPPMERIDGIGVVRLAGTTTLEGAVAMVTDAIVQARQAGIARLMVTITGLDGFGSPSLAARHAMVRGWATAAGGRVQVALVIQPHLADPERFGIVVAANFGLVANSFSDEAEALAWLREAG